MTIILPRYKPAIKRFIAKNINNQAFPEKSVPMKKLKHFTTFYRLKRRIKQRINNAKHPKKYLKKNMVPNAYSTRFLQRRTRSLFKKTQGLKTLKIIKRKHEETFYSKLPYKIQQMEKRLFYTKNFYMNRFRTPLSRLRPKYAKFYISNYRRNTFTSVTQAFSGKNFDRSFKLVYKTSCGAIGYRGPKRKTQFARDDVIKRSAAFITDNYFTTTDVVFNKKPPRWGYKHLRNMFTNLIYFRAILFTQKRPHGFTRKQKERRK